jgi:sulfatase maturation enzyme AslB (radical SAM superfamily)
MAGVTAGSAILNVKETGKLHTLTVTVNNQCNLKCPHCYLQYQGRSGLIAPDAVDYLFAGETSMRHIAIVGMEPLATKSSVEICRSIAVRAKRAGLTSSLITNGLNLNWLGQEALSNLDFIDISLDGGWETYKRYRGGDLAKIEQGIAWATALGFKQFNALEVLNDQTLGAIDDTMDFAGSQPFHHIMFSPYIPTEVQGDNTVSMIPLHQLLASLQKSSAFMADERAFLTIDIYHCWYEGISLDEARTIAKQAGMAHKVHFISCDPTALGVIRLTYDGLVLSSFDALHTQGYQSKGRPIGTARSLDDHYVVIKDRLIQSAGFRKAA